MIVQGPFQFQQTVPQQPVNDLHVIFTGTGGSLNNVVVTQGPPPLAAAASGNTVDIIWADPLPVGIQVGFTVQSAFAPIRVDSAIWTNNSAPVGPAVVVPLPGNPLGKGPFRVEVVGCDIPLAATREFLDTVEQGALVGIAGRAFGADPHSECRVVIGSFPPIRPLRGFSRSDLLVFSVPPVDPGNQDIRIQVRGATLDVGSVLISAAYMAPSNSADLLDQFITGAEAVFLGLEGLFRGQTQAIQNASEREELMIYIANFASSSRALFHLLKTGARQGDAASIGKFAIRINATGILVELDFFNKLLNDPSDGQDKSEKGKWIEEDIKGLIEHIPDQVHVWWDIDLSYLKKVLNKLVSLILGRLGKQKSKE